MPLVSVWHRAADTLQYVQKITPNSPSHQPNDSYICSNCKWLSQFLHDTSALLLIGTIRASNLWRSACHSPAYERTMGHRIYIIITKTIRYLLWSRGAWRFFHDTYLTIEVQGIRCTNHLHYSFPLTDVNPHFIAHECRYYFKINSWWPIVTSSTHGPAASYCDVIMAHCSHGYLWTHDTTGIYGRRELKWLR